MGQVKVLKVPEFKKKGKEAFVRLFINKALEPVAEKIYDYLVQMDEEQFGYLVMGPYFMNLYKEMYEFAGLHELVKNLHDDKWLNDKYELTDSGTILNIRRGIDLAYVGEVMAITRIVDNIKSFSEKHKDQMQISDMWKQVFEILPKKETILCDENNVITPDYLRRVDGRLKLFQDAIELLAGEAREVYTYGIIEIVKKSGIKPSNALYRDIYDCLKMADLISEDQLRLHESSTSRYVRENYIKAKYQRQQGGQ